MLSARRISSRPCLRRRSQCSLPGRAGVCHRSTTSWPAARTDLPWCVSIGHRWDSGARRGEDLCRQKAHGFLGGLSGERGASGSAAWVPSWMASGRDPVSTVWMPTWHVPQSGITLMPSVEITSASFGTGTAPIVPTVLMRSPWIITILSRMGLQPKPSTSVPPMRALRRPDCALAAGA